MFIKLTQEEKQAIIDEIKRFYVEERGEEVGDIAAIRKGKARTLLLQSGLEGQPQSGGREGSGD
ncbi:hypothetical protein CHCC14600_2736 [Bacillus licheniformis]|nr:hypothetical protein CHCC14600_2736 [Bacillus licheniformis]